MSALAVVEDGHGDPNRYAAGCRCRSCTKAAVRADAQRKLDRMAGRPRSISADPARERLEALVAKGFTICGISRVSGADTVTVRRVLSGRQPTMHRRTANRILSVPLTADPEAPFVSSLGATRRVRALYALGHFTWRIAEEVGCARTTIHAVVTGAWNTIAVQIDQDIRGAYDRMSMSVGKSWQTRRLAERNGWAPPLAWDDDTIDDPAAEPVLDAAKPAAVDGDAAAARWLAGESVVLGPAAKREVIRHLFEWTDEPLERIAARLEMSPEATIRAWERMKQRAREEGRPVPWRRLYVDPKTLGLSAEKTRNEMESAA